jgi:hypothetical protein
MAKVETRWVYGAAGTTENKATSRSAIPGGSSYECIGFDGMEEGTMRPFPGFLKVHDLGPTGGYAALQNNAGSTGDHNQNSQLLDFFPVSFRIRTDGYAYGFVYRVKRAATSLSDVYIDYWGSTGAQWVRAVILKEGVSSTAQMSVTVWGRFIYVFVEGEKPSLAYAPSSATDTLTRVGVNASPFPGPGKRPVLLSHDRSTTIGGLTTLSGYPGRGQVVLTTKAPSALTVWPAGASGSGFAVPQTTTDTRLMAAGNYAFAYQLYDTRSGRRSALSDISQVRTEDFSSTGAVATAAPRYILLEVAYDKALYDQVYIYRSVRIEGVGGTYAAGTLHLEVIADLIDYKTTSDGVSTGHSIYYYELEDKALVFQDVFFDSATYDENVPSAGASLLYEGTLLLGKIKSNSTLGAESTTLENRDTDGMRGMGEIRYSSLVMASPELFPPRNRYLPPVPTNEVVVFAQVGGNVIGFSRDRQYYIRKDSNYVRVEQIHEGFGVAGYKAVDSIGSYLYTVTPKGVKAVDAQGQLEDVKSLNKLITEEWSLTSLSGVSIAYDAAMSCLFILNPSYEQAACLWLNTGRVTELLDLPFSQVARGVWPLLNSDGSTTASATPLVERAFFVADVPKSTAVEPIYPVESAFSNYRPRVYVVDKDRQRTKTVMGVTGQKGVSVLPLDGDAYHTVNAEVGGDGREIVLQAGATSTAATPKLPTDVEGAYLYVISSSDPTYIGKRAKILLRYPRSAPGTNSPLIVAEEPMPDGTLEFTMLGLPAGSRVVISPMICRWVAGPLTQQKNEQAFAGPSDHFRMKVVSSVGLVFTGVEGAPLTLPAGNSDARHSGLLYLGDDEDVTWKAISRDRNGEVCSTLREGETLVWTAFGAPEPQTQAGAAVKGRFGIRGAVLTPGVEIITADIDYRIIGMTVKGEVEETFTSSLT